MATEETVQSTIDQAWEVATDSMEQAFDYSASAVTAAQSYTSTNDQIPLTVGEPTVYGLEKIAQILKDVDDVLNSELPNRKKQIFSDLVEKATGLQSIFAQDSTWDSKDSLQLIDTLSDAFTDTFTFGSGKGGFAETVNDLSEFLTGNLVYDSNGNVTNAPYGVSTDAENLMRQRAFDAITKEANRAEDEVLAAYSARGFPMPSGAVARRIEEIQDKAEQNKANMSRDVYVDQAKRGFEATQRYITQFQALQVQAKDIFMEYLRASIQANSGKSEDLKFLIDSIVKLRSTMSELYARLKDDKDLLLKKAIAEWDLGIKRGSVDKDYYAKRVATQVDAAIAGAQAMGNLAAAAVGSQNTMATLAHETTKEE